MENSVNEARTIILQDFTLSIGKYNLLVRVISSYRYRYGISQEDRVQFIVKIKNIHGRPF